MIWYDMIWYDMIWYDMIWYDMIWYVWYDVIWYDMIWYDMIWYDMIWYDMIWYDKAAILFVSFVSKACVLKYETGNFALNPSFVGINIQKMKNRWMQFLHNRIKNTTTYNLRHIAYAISWLNICPFQPPKVGVLTWRKCRVHLPGRKRNNWSWKRIEKKLGRKRGK